MPEYQMPAAPIGQPIAAEVDNPVLHTTAAKEPAADAEEPAVVGQDAQKQADARCLARNVGLAVALGLVVIFVVWTAVADRPDSPAPGPKRRHRPGSGLACRVFEAEARVLGFTMWKKFYLSLHIHQ